MPDTGFTIYYVDYLDDLCDLDRPLSETGNVILSMTKIKRTTA